MTSAAKWILAVALAAFISFGLVACGGDDESGNGNGETTAAQTQTEESTSGGDETTEVVTPEPGDESDAAQGEEIDELLAMHPIFPTKRFMNLAAQGNPEACSLLSDKGRRAMQRAHGMPCPQVIRTAASDREEPGLTIAGEFVPVDGFSDLEFPTTIYVLNREFGRISIGAEPRPVMLSKYGRIWLIDRIPLADIGTVS